jgi:predicted MPP superfamily phosphohydrolase
MSPGPTPRKKISRRNLLIGTGGGVLVGSGVGFIGSENLTVNRQTLHLPNWDADGFRLVQVSDIHANTPEQAARATEAFQKAVQEKPDLIVFTGDFLDFATTEACAHVKAALDELHDAQCPCYAVFGNHDWYTCQNTDRLHRTVRSSPLKLLSNHVVEVNGVTLVGLDDALEGRCRPNHINWNATSKSLLVMLHEPDSVGIVPKQVSLMISGHSHGGEICLPFGIPLKLPKGASKYHTGFYPDAHVPLYVSRGVATCAPFRMFCPPEINVLTLYGTGNASDKPVAV